MLEVGENFVVLNMVQNVPYYAINILPLFLQFSSTIMKSFLKKIARELTENLHKNPMKFPDNSRAISLKYDFIIVRLSHIRNPAINLRIAELRLMRNPPLVIHQIGILMFKNHFECVPSVIKYLFTANASAHNYNTRNKHKLRAAYGKQNFMNSNFRFVGIKI